MEPRVSSTARLIFLLTCAMLLVTTAASAEHGAQPAQRTGREGTFGIGAFRIGVGKRVTTTNQSPSHKMTLTNRFWGVAWMPKAKGDMPRGAALGVGRSSHQITTAPGQTYTTQTRTTGLGRMTRYTSTQSGPGAAKTVSKGTMVHGKNTFTTNTRMTGAMNQTYRTKTHYDRAGNSTKIVTTTRQGNGPATTHVHHFDPKPAAPGRK